MKDSYEEQKKQNGFLVIDEFPISLAPSDFIKILTLPDKYPSFEFANWTEEPGNEKQISLLSAKYIYLDGKHLYLYSLPGAMDRTIKIEQLEGPASFIGFIIIVDANSLLAFGKRVDKSFSAIYIAKKYDLPIIIAVLNSAEIEKSREKLSQFIDLSPDMPVVWHGGDIDLDLVTRTMDIVYKYI
jgi:hypothetical protein